MQIKKYGITLSRLKEKDIELVREKRNSEAIRNAMHYRDYISPEMQQMWFNSINNIYNHYYIIEYNGEKIGLTNGKNINYEKRTSEGGIFIWDEKYWGTMVPAMSAILFTDFTFYFGNIKKVYAKILKANSASVTFNRMLGFRPTNEIKGDEHIQWYINTPQTYEESAKKIKHAIKVLTNDRIPFSILNISFNDDTSDDIKKLYTNNPPDMQKAIDEVLNRGNLYAK